jgi:hypothetical protein
MSRGFALLIAAAALAAPALADEARTSYSVTPGSIGGVPTTILMDQATGKTWYLGEVDAEGKISLQPPAGATGSPIWVAIPFAPGAPKIPPR